MVARHKDHLSVDPQRPADQPQDRLGDVHRALGPLLQQLDDITEQHKPLDTLKRPEQPVQRLRLREDVVP